MTEDREDLLNHYRQMGEELDTAVADLTDEQLRERSLDGWSVTDHLSHVALWDEARAAEVARISAGHSSGFRMTEEQDNVYDTLAHELRSEWSPAQARWEVATTRRRLLEAIAAAPAEALDPSHYGEAGLRTAHAGLHATWIRRWREEKGI
jgi:Mycothiol maleylpyruvate isomerase N-terminal domain